MSELTSKSYWPPSIPGLLWQITALEAENAALKVKANRWDEVLKHIGAESDSRGRQDFVLRGLDDSRVDLMTGSVAEHFTNSIDKKLKGKP